jgi:hypothetical protein
MVRTADDGEDHRAELLSFPRPPSMGQGNRMCRWHQLFLAEVALSRASKREREGPKAKPWEGEGPASEVHESPHPNPLPLRSAGEGAQRDLEPLACELIDPSHMQLPCPCGGGMRRGVQQTHCFRILPTAPPPSPALPSRGREKKRSGLEHWIWFTRDRDTPSPLPSAPSRRSAHTPNPVAA